MPMRGAKSYSLEVWMPPVRQDSLLESIETFERRVGADNWLCAACGLQYERFGGWVQSTKGSRPMCYECYWGQEVLVSGRLC